MTIIVIDVETTGLDTNTARIIEVAAVDLFTPPNRMYFVPWHNGFNPRQDGDALAINRYFERGVYKEMATQSATSEFYELLHELLLGNTIAGSNPRFDANILANQFLKMGLQPEPWHHRLLDLSTYAAGALGLPMDELPGLQKVCDILEVPFPDEHSAMGDVLATRNCLHRLDMTLRAQKTFAGIEPGPLG